MLIDPEWDVKEKEGGNMDTFLRTKLHRLSSWE